MQYSYESSFESEKGIYNVLRASISICMCYNSSFEKKDLECFKLV